MPTRTLSSASSDDNSQQKRSLRQSGESDFQVKRATIRLCSIVDRKKARYFSLYKKGDKLPSSKSYLILSPASFKILHILSGPTQVYLLCDGLRQSLLPPRLQILASLHAILVNQGFRLWQTRRSVTAHRVPALALPSPAAWEHTWWFTFVCSPHPHMFKTEPRCSRSTFSAVAVELLKKCDVT